MGFNHRRMEAIARSRPTLSQATACGGLIIWGRGRYRFKSLGKQLIDRFKNAIQLLVYLFQLT
jgi:hypothetical protein